MGLTLHYTLGLPGDRSPADVRAILERLRDKAAEQPVRSVSPVFDLADGLHAADETETGQRHLLAFFADCVADPYIEEGTPTYDADADSTIGFSVDLGEGAEPATFALLRRRRHDTAREEWYWWCACKTQYASNEGEEHFVRVHTSLVAILDVATDLGLVIDVHDEGDYWETRSRPKLVGHVRRMNHILAAFGGALSDALGDEHDVQAEIFEHPEFERLEMGEPRGGP